MATGYKAEVSFGSVKFVAYRVNLSGAYEGANKIIEREHQQQGRSEPAVVEVYEGMGSRRWNKVDTQTVEPGHLARH